MPHHVPLSTDLFDVMHTMRAMRRLKPDPVPDELVFKILRAGQAAASGSACVPSTSPCRLESVL